MASESFHEFDFILCLQRPYEIGTLGNNNSNFFLMKKLILLRFSDLTSVSLSGDQSIAYYLLSQYSSLSTIFIMSLF